MKNLLEKTTEERGLRLFESYDSIVHKKEYILKKTKRYLLQLLFSNFSLTIQKKH